MEQHCIMIALPDILDVSRPRHIVGLEAALECSCCGQHYHPNHSFQNRIEAFLFGTEPYAMCPICQQEVSVERQTERYKRRWRLEVLPSLDDRAIRVALLAIYLRRGLTGDEGFHKALLEAQAAYPDKTLTELKSLGDETLLVLNMMRHR
jgi:hypothetical protein